MSYPATGASPRATTSYAPGNGAFFVFDDSATGGTIGGLSGILQGLSNFDFKSLSPLAFGSFNLAFDDNGSGLTGTWSSASFSVVPVPAAVWLFASGLIGLAGIARRKSTR